jgi:FixJ family two-component response regulator
MHRGSDAIHLTSSKNVQPCNNANMIDIKEPVVGTVYLVDDDQAMLHMLQTLVSTLGVRVHAFASAPDFLAAYHASAQTCLVCDLRMPGMDGVELQRRLKEMDVPLPLIFLTGFAEVGVAVDAMREGAFDFLEKPFSAQALLGKIRAALDSSQALHAQWLERRARQARMALLTAKELAITRQVVAAKSSREISELLGLSVRTVENHRTRIMEKLHVESTVELVKLFM